MTSVGEPRPVRPVNMKAAELAEPIATFAAHLSELGYTPLTIAEYTDAARQRGLACSFRLGRFDALRASV